MENWVIYWLIGATFIGGSNFYSKVISHNNINKHRVFLYSMLCYIFIPLFYLIFNFEYIQFSILIFTLIVVRIITALEKNLFIVESLKYIETSLFFPIHKIIHIFLTFFIWMIAFKEYLNTTQFIALGLWVVAILFLTSKENRKIQIDYKKGILFLALSNLMIAMSSSINKYIAFIQFDIPTYMFLSWIFGAIYLLATKKDVLDKVDKATRKEEIKMGLLKGTLTFSWFIFLLYALREGPFVLVQVINTLSIFVPIILSVIIFHEKINLKKIIAFVLFLITIYLISI